MGFAVLFKMWKVTLGTGGIAGVIALIIAGTICYRYAQLGSEEIPEVLVYALTTIIGFYFGQAAKTGDVKDTTNGS
jgi:hypothetical protein